jgi:hypothetical protein
MSVAEQKCACECAERKKKEGRKENKNASDLPRIVFFDEMSSVAAAGAALAYSQLDLTRETGEKGKGKEES